MSTNFTIFSIEFIYHTTRFKAFDGMPHTLADVNVINFSGWVTLQICLTKSFSLRSTTIEAWAKQNTTLIILENQYYPS